MNRKGNHSDLVFRVLGKHTRNATQASGKMRIGDYKALSGHQWGFPFRGMIAVQQAL